MVATDLEPENGELTDRPGTDLGPPVATVRSAAERENQALRTDLADTLVALTELRNRFDALTRSHRDDPRSALREIASLGRRLREVEAEQVQAALGRGFSYAEIAAELGVTRQSVHQKHPRRSGGGHG